MPQIPIATANIFVIRLEEMTSQYMNNLCCTINKYCYCKLCGTYWCYDCWIGRIDHINKNDRFVFCRRDDGDKMVLLSFDDETKLFYYGDFHE